jgi:diguanylate cyclase (GGDEF)-like protein
MSTVPGSLSQSGAIPAVATPPSPALADRWLTELHTLLRELEAATAANHTLPPVFSEAVDDRLVQVRLGAVASLFAALRCKNAATAGHALRVALNCSAWALQMDLPESERDAVEVAALLHDVGIIGAPDHILLKAATLDADETAVMSRARRTSLDILRSGCTSPQLLEIVESIPAWYDGSGPGKGDRSNLSGRPEGCCTRIGPVPFSGAGRHIPLGARMIAIVEAFDAMTTDHVYRPARSQERAMAELFRCAGTQFDPELVERFAEFRQGDQAAIHWEVAHRWLRSLEPGTVDSFWELSAVPLPVGEPTVDALFQGRLLDNMYDAVVFIDGAGRVVLWNRGTERLTGVPAASVRGEMWHPELLGLSDEKGHPVNETDCPIHTAIRCGAQSLRRLTILGRGRRPVAVDTHAIPVIDEQGISQGAILLFHDASSETSLEQRCQSLHEKATKDPLTQVANRAEFDRVHAMFVAAHQQQQVPCSLLMCDLDRFKRVNDTFGHQAGDEAIKCLASLLKSSCRPGDLVARYGGEEFVLLCADCDNASAARRADQVRKALSQVPQPKMEGRSVTVSFGVTEIQPGDTPETMLRRADRALLMAKSNGRNSVVQLGSGSNDETAETQTPSRIFGSARPKESLQQDLITPVPVKIAIEKLRGFVADHQATIVTIDGGQVRLEIEDRPASGFRRFTDRSAAFWIDLSFEEERLQKERAGESPSLGGGATRTKIRVAISPRRSRDRRRDQFMARARDVLMSFRSYLMASEDESESPPGALVRAKQMLAPWLTK